MPETQPLYFDPFAGENGETFDPIASLAAIEQRYLNREIEHDYSADQFVRDAEALVMDSRFAGLMEQAAVIEARMHAMCGDHDHALSTSLRDSSIFGEQAEASDHSHSHSHEHNHDRKSKAKKKKSERVRPAAPRQSLLSFIISYKP